jgi:D-alanyl-D-alanine carboxypeptidase
MKRLTIGLVCTALAVTVTYAADAEGRAEFGDVQDALDTVAALDGVVGVIGEAYVDGRRVDRGSAGSRLVDGEGGKIPSSAGFRNWSQTKAMTYAVLMQLVDAGQLDLGDTLGDVLPVVVEQDLVLNADRITIQMLVDMTAGIPDHTNRAELNPFDTTTWYTPIDLLEVSRAHEEDVTEPGAEYEYSNTSYVLLGMIIERLTGSTLAEVFERRVFDPLEMDRTYLPTKPWEGIKGPHGHGYHPNPDGTLRDADAFNPGTLWAAAGVISTARDMATFYRALAHGELPSKEDTPDLCGGTVTSSRGIGPGSITKTYTSTDGSRQFTVSATVTVQDASQSFNLDLDAAAEAVLCPPA